MGRLRPRCGPQLVPTPALDGPIDECTVRGGVVDGTRRRVGLVESAGGARDVAGSVETRAQLESELGPRRGSLPSAGDEGA